MRIEEGLMVEILRSIEATLYLFIVRVIYASSFWHTKAAVAINNQMERRLKKWNLEELREQQERILSNPCWRRVSAGIFNPTKQESRRE